jgi:ADP-dependent NAD(P)H-hydrate dehydratase / NAD(P)H-hydrate epimerase
MILTVPQIRESEDFTMQTEPILSIDLMERAGHNFTEQLLKDFNIFSFSDVVIFCGPGNNGGDGLVIARYLSEIIKVKVVLVHFGCKSHSEVNINLERIKDNPNIEISDGQQFLHNIEQLDLPFSPLIIDAIFGIGLTQPLHGDYAKVVEGINSLNAFVVSVDLPSGLFSDQHTPADAVTILAHRVYSFQNPKLAFLLPENQERVVSFRVIDIGLLIPHTLQSNMKCINQEMCSLLLSTPKKFAHKGTKGSALLISGCATMPGATILAAKAAMRGGLGKLTVHSPSTVLDKLAVSVPEVVHSKDKDPEYFTELSDELDDFDAIAIGSGLGKIEKTTIATKLFLEKIATKKNKFYLVIDADALNIISENAEFYSLIPPYTIITPHLKEFERMAGKSSNDFERIEKVQAFSKKYQLIVILKGAHTMVALPTGELFFNMSGNPGMATAGSGDLLTGLLLSFLAQKYPPHVAALLAVFVHGFAADIAIEEDQSIESLIASDIPNYFGKAFNLLK